MINYSGCEDVIQIYIGDLPIIAVRLGVRPIWPEGSDPIGPDDPIIDSMGCYTSGMWLDQYAWTDDTPWVD